MNDYTIGSLVQARDRDWVVVPSLDPDLLLLRPLSGSEQDIVGIYLPLGLEDVEPAVFPPPDPERAGDYESAQLLWDTARLGFRSGAGPFRSLGRLSVRPRPYQLVPLLMALRLDPVRLLIADDVGIGKTIEAGLIAREMLDRGEARRLAVLCPPYLCDQWQKELAEKFHIDAVVLRSGTAGRLERALPRKDLSVFEYYPHLVISIDYAKAERRRDSFLLHAPDLVIVDEAHTAAKPAGRTASQQHRHQLLLDLAKRRVGHLLLLTATPHSGVEESFQSLLGLIKPQFAGWELSQLPENKRKELARHFVQRRRADVVRWMGEETPFPERISEEVPYNLTTEYRSLFNDVYDFAREIVRSGETLSGFRRRVRYWTALALLRCVMSSPAAAETALEGRISRLEEAAGLEAEDSVFSPYVYDQVDEEGVVDVAPSYIIEEGEHELVDSERKKLRSFARRAAKLRGGGDNKIAEAGRLIEEWLEKGFHPIIYCRYIATSDYVAKELQRRLKGRWPDIHVISVTGALSEDERTMRVAELSESPRRVLVATDCLSEGINLQEPFNAVVHYDLPWNPNRLEQREGRVDRYGQASEEVKAALLYGQDNPIDGAVLRVLIRKAIEIRHDLGIMVPVPVDSESVMEAVLKSLFLEGDTGPRQLSFGELEEAPDQFQVEDVHETWDRAADREKASRTRFAQHAIKPNEVARELEETDAILGGAEAVERFVKTACQRLGAPLQKKGSAWQLNAQELPPVLRQRLGEDKKWRLCFQTPAPEGAVYVGRNHPLTDALVEYLLDMAIDPVDDKPPASRSSVIRTNAVSRRTTVLLLRLRFMLDDKGGPSLAEECVVCAFSGRPGRLEWLAEDDALRLLQEAQPVGNVDPTDRRRVLVETLTWLLDMKDGFDAITQARAERLHESHRRVRRITRAGRLKVTPQGEPDVLGLYVLLPVPEGVERTETE